MGIILKHSFPYSPYIVRRHFILSFNLSFFFPIFKNAPKVVQSGKRLLTVTSPMLRICKEYNLITNNSDIDVLFDSYTSFVSNIDIF